MRVAKEMVIDCNREPFTPEGCEIKSHTPGGLLVWNPDNIQLYLTPEQQCGLSVPGFHIATDVMDKPILSACVADWLIDNAREIPESWKPYGATFWDTRFVNWLGLECVRFIFFGEEKWRAAFRAIRTSLWSPRYCAVLRNS